MRTALVLLLLTVSSFSAHALRVQEDHTIRFRPLEPRPADIRPDPEELFHQSIDVNEVQAFQPASPARPTWTPPDGYFFRTIRHFGRTPSGNQLRYWLGGSN